MKNHPIKYFYSSSLFEPGTQKVFIGVVAAWWDCLTEIFVMTQNRVLGIRIVGLYFKLFNATINYRWLCLKATFCQVYTATVCTLRV